MPCARLGASSDARGMRTCVFVLVHACACVSQDVGRWDYLLDARSDTAGEGLDSGYFSYLRFTWKGAARHTLDKNNGWERFTTHDMSKARDDLQRKIVWSKSGGFNFKNQKLVPGSWRHVYMQATCSSPADPSRECQFDHSDGITVFGRYKSPTADQNDLHARLITLHVWSHPLTDSEVDHLAEGGRMLDDDSRLVASYSADHASFDPMAIGTTTGYMHELRCSTTDARVMKTYTGPSTGGSIGELSSFHGDQLPSYIPLYKTFCSPSPPPPSPPPTSPLPAAPPSTPPTRRCQRRCVALR